MSRRSTTEIHLFLRRMDGRIVENESINQLIKINYKTNKNNNKTKTKTTKQQKQTNNNNKQTTKTQTQTKNIAVKFQGNVMSVNKAVYIKLLKIKPKGRFRITYTYND